MTGHKWKFLHLSGDRIVSAYDHSPWVIGEWREASGTLVPCRNGFHASDGILAALGYVRDDVLARVEVAGDSVTRDDKSVHERMKITRAYRWARRDSVALAVYAAEAVLDIFESRYPGDVRPRKAIEAAKAWLAVPTGGNQQKGAPASPAADAAASAYSAAADAAYSAAAADAASARKAARQELHAQVEAWLQARVPELEVISA